MRNATATFETRSRLQVGQSTDSAWVRQALSVPVYVQRAVTLDAGEVVDVVGGDTPYIEGIALVRHLVMRSTCPVQASLFSVDPTPSQMPLYPRGLIVLHGVEFSRVQLTPVPTHSGRVELWVGGDPPDA